MTTQAFSLEQHQKQMQRLLMLPQMQQALQVLQLPVMELAPLLEIQMHLNPILTDEEESEEEEEAEEEEAQEEQELIFNDTDLAILKHLDEEFRSHLSDEEYTPYTNQDREYKTYQEQSITSSESLFEHLLHQAKEVLSQQEDLEAMELVIGSLDANGFLTTPISELEKSKVDQMLSLLKTFDPPGIGATSLQESLLIQLRFYEKEQTLAWRILEEFYEDLLHHRLTTLQKKLKCTAQELTEAIQRDIARLDLHPGASYAKQTNQQITPDATILHEGDQLTVVVHDDFIPSIHFNRRYMQMMEDPATNAETKGFIRNQLASIKWLMRNVHERNSTLEKILKALTVKQRLFFTSPTGQLKPLMMKTLAEEIGVNESTIVRAVANKYVASPRGLLALRTFFTNSYSTDHGVEISSTSVREAVHSLIQNEDKKSPLSDAGISKQLKSVGITCARRTVAKYRSELNIGNARQRKIL